METADKRGNAVVNKTRGVVLHHSPVWARTFLQMATGLMFREPKDECLVFLFLPSRREVITMWFVFAPIDVIALDGQGRVLAMRSDLRPWRMWDAGVLASAMVELPAGTISRTRTAVGDRIAIPSLGPGSIWSWWHYALFAAVQVIIASLLLLVSLLLVLSLLR